MARFGRRVKPAERGRRSAVAKSQPTEKVTAELLINELST